MKDIFNTLLHRNPWRRDVDIFFAAAEEGNTQILDQYISRFSMRIVDKRNDSGNTALMVAAWNNRVMAVPRLLEGGAAIDAVNGSGYTALMWVAQTGYNEAVLLLLEKGASVDATDAGGHTALAIAEKHGKEGAAFMLRMAMERREENRRRDMERAVRDVYKGIEEDMEVRPIVFKKKRQPAPC
jgi:uncharacterized protein